MKRWMKITICTQPVLVESITDFLIGVMDAGVEVGVDENIELKTINAYLEKNDPNPQEISNILKIVSGHLNELAQIFSVGQPRIDWQEIKEEDWGKNWKKHFVPFSITDRLVIAPTWEKYTAKNDELVLVMDPGMAFGTGHHATTALALQMVEDEICNNSKKKSVLDVGTGTGILGMAAALMGAVSVHGVDNDPVAVMAAQENIAKNNLTDLMQVGETPIRRIEDKFSLVIANIIHDVLVEMAGDLYRLTEKGGILVLSGILYGTQVNSIKTVFTEQGFLFNDEKRKNEWAALRFGKP